MKSQPIPLNRILMNTADFCMKNPKHILTLLTAGLMVLNTFAAEAPDRPLHVLYLGPVSASGGARGGGGFGGFGGPRTNYIYLPGQTLAPEAIYFDYLTATTNLTGTYLKHFDAVVQVMPDAEVGAAQQQLLGSSNRAGNGQTNYKDVNRDTAYDLLESFRVPL